LPVTSELIHFTVSRDSSGVTEQFPLIQILIPHVMGLKEQLKDSSKVRNILTMFSINVLSVCLVFAQIYPTKYFWHAHASVATPSVFSWQKYGKPQNLHQYFG
jgi:hypothetical protein